MGVLGSLFNLPPVCTMKLCSVLLMSVAYLAVASWGHEAKDSIVKEENEDGMAGVEDGFENGLADMEDGLENRLADTEDGLEDGLSGLDDEQDDIDPKANNLKVLEGRKRKFVVSSRCGGRMQNCCRGKKCKGNLKCENYWSGGRNVMIALKCQ